MNDYFVQRAIEAKPNRFYTKKKRQFIARKNLPHTLKDEQQYVKDLESWSEQLMFCMSRRERQLAMGLVLPDDTQQYLEWRDNAIARLFNAMGMVVLHVRVINDE